MMPSPSVGVFSDVVGLSYRSGNVQGNIGPDGKFEYIQGEEVTFSIGPLQLGTTKGKPRMTFLNLVNSPSLDSPKLLNRTRLLFSLAPGIGFEKPVLVDDKVSAIELIDKKCCVRRLIMIGSHSYFQVRSTD